MITGLFATVIAAMILGLKSKWGYAVLVVVCYVILGWGINRTTKHYSNKYLKQGHFLLSLVCRSENNRVFLRHHLEMRPGFQGKWLEFLTHDTDLSVDQIIEKMMERQHKIKYSVFLE